MDTCKQCDEGGAGRWVEVSGTWDKDGKYHARCFDLMVSDMSKFEARICLYTVKVSYFLNRQRLVSETGLTTAEALFERAGVTPQTHSLWRETRFEEDVRVKPGVVTLEPDATFYTAPNGINGG